MIYRMICHVCEKEFDSTHALMICPDCKSKDKRFYGKHKSAIGKKFGRLEVVSFESIDGARFVTCKCDCGTVKQVRWENLRSGKTRSCGCLLKEYERVVGDVRKSANTQRRDALIEHIKNNPQMTYEELATECGLSRERVRQVIVKYICTTPEERRERCKQSSDLRTRERETNELRLINELLVLRDENERLVKENRDLRLFKSYTLRPEDMGG